jgi:hypothetical protein
LPVGIKIGLAGSAPIRVARVGPENLRSRLLDDLAFVESTSRGFDSLAI